MAAREGQVSRLRGTGSARAGPKNQRPEPYPARAVGDLVFRAQSKRPVAMALRTSPMALVI
jgi:hypothetical protein